MKTVNDYSTVPFNLEATYVQLQDSGNATLLNASKFWETLTLKPQSSSTSGFGLLVSAYDFAENWTNWEAHPGGDEIVLLLSGEIDIILETTNGNQTVRLKENETFVIPRGTWHTADVIRPAKAVHITPGDGNQHRPRDS